MGIKYATDLNMDYSYTLRSFFSFYSAWKLGNSNQKNKLKRKKVRAIVITVHR